MTLSDKKAESAKMERVNAILRDPEFQENLNGLRGLEAERIFCRHDIDHLLATARLAYLFSLERGYELDKTLIYAAALLHDCGRYAEYTKGVLHDEAGALFAQKILSRYAYTQEEISRIVSAIKEHRGSGKDVEKADPLAVVLYDADKMSRDCFLCNARDECNWSGGKKNLTLMW